jgi:hypothetical protein
MTPKEKAQELVNKFREITIDDIDYYQCKPCALIAVDEILNSNPYKISLEGKFLTEHITYDINYWEEVKQEIEKL